MVAAEVWKSVSENVQLPRSLGDYAVLRPLGKGLERLRFAVRREAQEHPRLYVIKLFPPIPENIDETERERYVPRMTRGLSHRNLVEAYQTGEVQGFHYLVMEYVLSVDLELVLGECRRNGFPVPLEVALFVGREMCRGLAFLHGFGADKLLHGRVAPSHVLLAYSGQLKLAHVHRLLKVGATTSVASQDARQVAPYQAPELLDGRPVDQRSDVFAVGAILWEMLAGQRFEAGRLDSTRERVLSGELRLAELNPDVPSEMNELLDRSLGERPEDRFHTAVDLGRRLDSLLEKHSPGAGGRLTSDWLVGRFREEFRGRRRMQQQLLAEKRAETASHKISEVRSDSDRRTGNLIGQVLDQRYRIKHLLGEGGMGQVYEAEHAQLGKRLAVKILHPLYSTEEEVVERFRREAQAASSIGHPNIVNVTDSGTTPDGRAYFVMELLDGMELADVITQEGPFDYERAVDIAIQVCQALGAAHRVGVIHRDLKPENIFLTTVGARTDVVKILDFGIAKNARLERARGGQLTEPGLAVGTPEYMAPEQAAGKPPNPRFDIYAVGGILYAVLTGRPPHRGSNVMEILTRKATRNPTPPRSYRPDIPVALEAAVMTALARSPERRPATMEELEYELRKSLAGRPNAVAHMLGISHALSGARSGEVYSSDSDPRAQDPRLGSGEHSPAAGVAPGKDPLGPEGVGLSLGPVGVTQDGLDDEPEPWVGSSHSGSEANSPAKGPRGEAGPRPASQSPTLPDQELFSPAVTPTDLVQWDSVVGSNEREVDEQATTSVYLDTSDLSEPLSHDPDLRRRATLWAAGLLGVLAVTALLGWVLWPAPPPPPSFLEQPSTVVTGPGGVALATPSLPQRLPSLVGWEVALPAEVVDPETLARWQGRELERWVSFTQRAIQDHRYLEPERDCAQYGLDRIANLKPDQPELSRLRQRTVNSLLGQAARLRRRGKIDEAEKILRGILTISPESKRGKVALASLLIARGRTALGGGQIPEAEALGKEALSLDSAGVEPLLLGAEILEAQGKPTEALAAYEAARKSHQGNRAAAAAVKRLQRERRKRPRRPRR